MRAVICVMALGEELCLSPLVSKEHLPSLAHSLFSFFRDHFSCLHILLHPLPLWPSLE